ncbi:hypothetical protein [Candidatus Nitrosopumilus sediminis]|uniref:hypothetical protein n=1 Tax=Candidatus Nitrosopumilus sediminis TaxID=1229909 RepID=UPI00037F0302|nr:hypothetical protein [Candidatus Nitrosopumilus sediminis]
MYIKPKAIIYIIIGILFTAGILIINFTDIFSETWFIGLILIGISMAIIAITIILKMRS